VGKVEVKVQQVKKR